MVATMSIKPLPLRERRDLEFLASTASRYVPRDDEEKAVISTAKERLQFDDMVRRQQASFATPGDDAEDLIPDSPSTAVAADDGGAAFDEVDDQELVEKRKDPNYEPEPEKEVEALEIDELPPVTPFKKPRKPPRSKKPKSSDKAVSSTKPGSDKDKESDVQSFEDWAEFRYVGKNGQMV